MSESSRGRGKKMVAPRGRGRRTAAEREAILKSEQERTKERDDAYAKEQNEARVRQEREARQKKAREQAAARGRGGGRGGFFGVKHESSGPLSGGSAISSSVGQGKAFPRPWAPSSRSGGSRAGAGTVRIADSTGGRSGGGGGGGGSRTAKSGAVEFNYVDGVPEGEPEDGGYISSDLEEEDAGPRLPINDIIIISDDEDGEPRDPFGAPVMMPRQEHRGRPMLINDPTASTGEKEIKKEDGDEAMPDAPDTPSKGKSKARDKSLEVISERPFQGAWRPEPEIKEEPMTDEQAHPRARTAPKDITGEGEIEPRTRKAPVSKAAQDLLLHEEERKERERLQADAEAMLEEFSDPSTHKEGNHSYLFQFPPILPNLAIQKPITIKDDPDAPPAIPTQATNGINTKDAPIKVEDGEPIDPLKPEPTADASVRPSHLPTLASGSVGKLRVHKSGKVTMDWGGTALVVQNAVTPSFLQNLVMLRMDEQAPGAPALTPGQMAGTATSFGQPKGKFVVQPNWVVLLPDQEDGKGKKIKAEPA